MESPSRPSASRLLPFLAAALLSVTAHAATSDPGSMRLPPTEPDSPASLFAPTDPSPPFLRTLVAGGNAASAPLPPAPIVQQAYLKADNTRPGSWLGASVAISDDTVVVGAPDEGRSGAAYVFVRTGTTWSQQAYLKASHPDPGDSFGRSVALSGDTIVVGAQGESGNGTGVSGNPEDNSMTYAGAAYVFVRTGTTWTQQAYLKASNTDAGDYFGSSVAVSGNTIVVGARWERSGAQGVNAQQQDNSAPDAGAAYVFVRNDTQWTQQAYLKASNAEREDDFGMSVAISGDTVVVGAYGEDSEATGVNQDQEGSSRPVSGAAYVFVRSGTTWTQQAYLKASNPRFQAQFGWSVAVSGDTVVVGARYEGSNATGVDGNQQDNSALWAGAAYVFARKGSTWRQEAYLKASNTRVLGEFGTSVAVSGDTVVIGAPTEGNNATGVNGNQTNGLASDSGAAYVFVRSGTAWSQKAYLKASNTQARTWFGTSVAVHGETIVVGSWGEDSNATGINGNQDDTSASAAGAAYVFATGHPPPVIDPGSVAVLGNGVLQGSFTGQGGLPFTVLTSTNPALPAEHWQNLGAPVEDPPKSGRYQFHDSQAPGHPARFYRVRSP